MIELHGDASRGEDWAWIRLTVVDGRIAEAVGEGAGIAPLVHALTGLTLLRAAATPGEPLALEALAAALGPAVKAPADERRVVVAMSGGVDSAVALLRSRDAGFEPVGATLRLWVDPAAPDGERACCSPSSVAAARRACHDLGVPHVTLDLRREFRRAVVGEFVDGYRRGETPNPCVRCNGSFRFHELLRLADRIGASRLVTGHYARLVEHGGATLIAAATDREKDQSYMLAFLDPTLLPRLLLPLGGQAKQTTREQARTAGLAASERAESQEACFLGGQDYRAFLERHGLAARDGPIVTDSGQELGRHGGYWRYTVGQRRGLGVSSGSEPLYVLSTVPERNAVVVGRRAELEVRRIGARGRLYAPVDDVMVKVRYRSPATPASVTAVRDRLAVELHEPVYGVAAGQAAVLYDDDVVVGAGVIDAVA